MPRRPRLEYENAICHVVTRGEAHRKLFHGASHYERFLTLKPETRTLPLAKPPPRRRENVSLGLHFSLTFAVSVSSATWLRSRKHEGGFGCGSVWEVSLVALTKIAFLVSFQPLPSR